ncbi:hypothetical protein AS850_13245 [Frondihabitans sp. 762G35]|uniref:alpha/beta hydrolase n=1 Tax=Frondihabitans sp. 762G35 TaxID=1446794 RepID=UPI000D221D55|nr:alpha/beta hydrolase-fold protein [Frondihabitans sp. 762G35]ARC58044.1 hypothetical protein AS850_13245 [Frondihabitans sp. 762G35]
MTGEDGRRVSRRALIAGGSTAAGLGILTLATGVAVDQRILPGRSRLYRALGLDGDAGVVPTASGGHLVSGSFRSTHRGGRTVGWSIAYPPGSTPGDPLPVVVVLHAYGGNHGSAFGSRLGLDHFLAQSVERGGPRFAIAAADGGNTYWHARSSGEDAAAMVTDEFLPLLAERGLDTRRIGLFGWSMGGYGVLRLGGVLGASRVAAVVAESPALWHTAAQAAGPAFDSAADFRANTVYGRQESLAGVAVRVDCGTGDGFCPNARDYVAGFAAAPSGGFEPGAHDLDYWRRMAPAQLAFLGAHLA